MVLKKENPIAAAVFAMPSGTGIESMLECTTSVFF
jgi:hypothetical protein